jgi:hypothetical protein
MIRLLVAALVVIVILLIFGAKSAAGAVADWTLTIVKWVFIIGAVVLVGAMIFSRRK